MPELVQHVVVTIVALGAAGVLVRQVLALVAPGTPRSSCARCASGQTPCNQQVDAGAGTPTVIPIQGLKKA